MISEFSITVSPCFEVLGDYILLYDSDKKRHFILNKKGRKFILPFIQYLILLDSNSTIHFNLNQYNSLTSIEIKRGKRVKIRKFIYCDQKEEVHTSFTNNKIIAERREDYDNLESH